MRGAFASLALGLASSLLLPRASEARAEVKIEILSRGDAYEGRRFGESGSYERILAIAHMRIDPMAPENDGIVDLKLAPRDANGLVDYDVDVVILRPSDPAHARRVLIYDVVNRGMKLLGMANGASMMTAGDPIAEGDGLLMRQGYTMVWSGWQGDVSKKPMLGARFPTIGSSDHPVTGPISIETIFDDATTNSIALPYPAASLDPAEARLTVRALADSEAVTIPLGKWSFRTARQVIVDRPRNMDAGAIYRFEYVARDPKVMGLGFAATRDVISFLRHGSAGQGNPLADLVEAPCDRTQQGKCANPQGGVFSAAVAIGASQSGRYLRDFLWQGFNRDAAGRRVFDGVIPMIPGARQTFTNYRFAEPGRFSRQHEDHDVPGFGFPFTYATIDDPVTGKRDGILLKCTQTRTCPKLMHIDTSSEFWQAGASLVGTGGTGRDIAFPSNVRAYFVAGVSHAPGMVGPMCALPPNPLDHSQVVRALLLAMVDWTLGQGDPPASRWPRIDKGELISVEAVRGPLAPGLGLVWPKVVNRPVAPAGKAPWPVLVPAIDADGNDIAGIRLPEIAAPTGTYLGWNLRKEGYGAGDLCLIFGSYLPFARDAAGRGEDARPSLTERYSSAAARAERYSEAVESLRRERLLLSEDAKIMAQQVN